jgi:hypothetical protein
MHADRLPTSTLPKWLQEHLAREQDVAADENLREILNFASKQSKTVHTPTSSWESGDRMSRTNLTVLKFFALLFLLPGLGGLVFSAMVSTDYLENLPRFPAPAEQRMTPRNVHGVVVYQTVQEDERLSAMEYSSVSVFLMGLLLGIVYLEKWSSARQLELEADLLEEVEA